MTDRDICLCRHKAHGSWNPCGALANGDDNRCEWCRQFH